MSSPYLDAGALLSADEKHRYSLWRAWAQLPNELYVLWLMLNPSTANASKDDPTIKTCVHFTRAWGYQGLVVGNLFSMRSSKPKDLAANPLGRQGPWNIRILENMLAAPELGLVVVAWGNSGYSYAELELVRMVRAAGKQPHCLGTTKDGNPKHPLARGVHRIPRDQQPIPFYLPGGRHVG